MSRVPRLKPCGSTQWKKVIRRSLCWRKHSRRTRRKIFIYATSDYHLLRAGLYAGRAGFSCDGVGGRTAGYYLPNALLREYIAYVVMNKKRYLTIAAVVFALSLTLWGGLALLAWFARML